MKSFIEAEHLDSEIYTGNITLDDLMVILGNAKGPQTSLAISKAPNKQGGARVKGALEFE